jgi:hypothetical protein
MDEGLRIRAAGVADVGQAGAPDGPVVTGGCSVRYGPGYGGVGPRRQVAGVLDDVKLRPGAAVGCMHVGIDALAVIERRVVGSNPGLCAQVQQAAYH